MPKLLKVLSTAPNVKGTTIIANLYQCFGNVGMKPRKDLELNNFGIFMI